MLAREERPADRLFEVADAMTDGRWGEMQRFSCRLEAVQPHRRIESLERQQQCRLQPAGGGQ
jgi:hypothetical protein